MDRVIALIISGLVTGSIYGLAGTGLVLTYKTSGIFNVAHGATAAAAAYIFYWLHVTLGMNWLLAALLSIAVTGTVFALFMERAASILVDRTITMQIVCTIGLVLLVEGLGVIKYGPDPLIVPAYLPHGTETFRLGGVNISYEQLTLTVLAVLAVAALYVVFKYTVVGVSMRAVVDSPTLLNGQGISATAVRRAAWLIGSVFAALCGVLMTPLVGLDAVLLTFLVVQSFGAAAVGAFSNIPLTFLGGLVIGVASSLTTTWVGQFSWLSSMSDTLPLIVLIAVLLLLPRQRLVAATRAKASMVRSWRPPPRIRISGLVLGAIVLAIVPSVVGGKLPFYTTGLVYGIILLSLGLLVRMSGQVSLCHASFAAIGAVALSQFTLNAHIPWLLALLLAGLVAVPAGALIAIPAIRLSGLFLALATLGFGIAFEYIAYPESWMFSILAQGRAVPRPSFAEGDHAFYYLVLVLVAVISVLYMIVSHSRLGRLLRALSDSPTATRANGLSVSTIRVTVFCMSAFLAAIAGGLYAASLGFATGSDTFFAPFTSLLLLVMVVIAPLGEPWFALIPAISMVLPGYLQGDTVVPWLNVVFGVSAVMVALQPRPPQLPVAVRNWLERIGGARQAEDRLAFDHPAESAEPPARPVAAGAGLEVRSLSVRFGGVQAVRSLDLDVPPGKITGLIGPNGAGKTSAFNACSGMNSRYDGTVRLHGRDVSRLAPAARARIGLGRTFQRFELCDNLTVFENVMLGSEAPAAGASVLRQLAASPKQKRKHLADTARAIRACGLEDVADASVGLLSTGHRRLVELARCLAGPFDVLLLDEPTSGLDRAETERFAGTLRGIVRDKGVSILLVEHDMSFVMDLCERIYVMDFGESIFYGSPSAVQASELVQAAYLGGGVDAAEPAPAEVVDEHG